jgi:hypothetical protein
LRGRRGCGVAVGARRGDKVPEIGLFPNACHIKTLVPMPPRASPTSSMFPQCVSVVPGLGSILHCGASSAIITAREGGAA